MVDSPSKHLFLLVLLFRGVVIMAINQIPDKTLLQKVDQCVQRTGTGSQSRVKISVSRGEVTLKGTIQYEMQRHNIMRAANRVAGVRRVIDQLTVEAKRKNF